MFGNGRISPQKKERKKERKKGWLADEFPRALSFDS
jgi:hypothetical protein